MGVIGSLPAIAPCTEKRSLTTDLIALLNNDIRRLMFLYDVIILCIKPMPPHVISLY